MSVRRTSSRTNVNSAYNTAAVQTSNSKTIAPASSVTLEEVGGTFAPAITAVAITDSDYNLIDDTAVSTSGGYIKITGSGFASGCVVYVAGVAATTTTFVSYTEVRAQIPATSSNTLHVYLVNPNGGAGIYLSGITFSGFPTWTTSSPLSDQAIGSLFSIQLDATGDGTVLYTLADGSSLPPGTSLSVFGVFSGTVVGLTDNTTYSFSVVATDSQNQTTPRTFAVTLLASDPNFKYTTLLLNTTSTNNANNHSFVDTAGISTITRSGNVTQGSFSPISQSGWSYFNNATNNTYLTTAAGVSAAMGSQFAGGRFTIEAFIYPMNYTNGNSYRHAIVGAYAAAAANGRWWFGIEGSAGTSASLAYTYTTGTGSENTVTTSSSPIELNQWTHVAVTIDCTTSSSATITMFANGSLIQTFTGQNMSTQTTMYSSPTIGGIAATVSANAFNGYINNLKIQPGALLYTGAYTVPTTDLTTISTTALMTGTGNRFRDTSANAFAITNSYTNIWAQPFSPFPTGAAYATTTSGGSSYYDGTADHLTVPDNAALEFTSGDFCFETSFLTTTLSGTGVIIDKRSGTYGPILLWRSSATLVLYMSSTNLGWDMVNGTTLIATVSNNSWYHVAVYRVGVGLYASVNGVITTLSASNSNTPHNNAGNWFIGTGNNLSDRWTGFIGDTRLIIGAHGYTSISAPIPTAQLTATATTKLLLNFTNAGIYDAAGKHVIETIGNAQVSSTTFKYGTESMYFDGAGDWLYIISTPSTMLGVGPFTIEFWANIATADAGLTRGFIGKGQAGAGWQVVSNIGQYPYFTETSANIFSNTAFTTNSWNHIAVVRSNTAASWTKLYLNGNVVATGTVTTDFTQTNPMYIGADRSAANPFKGYLDEVRISRYARYTQNFTAPTGPFLTR